MASYSEDLTCSICLTIFTDPVILFCGHSFCKECITLSLSSQDQCPHSKEAEKRKKEVSLGSSNILETLVCKHEEKLKLFCVTDQELACIICRDGEKHEGHKFKPIKEAAASLRNDLETFVQRVSGDIHDMEGKANTQKEEIRKTGERARQLESQISSQFEEMHEFLRKREDEIKNEFCTNTQSLKDVQNVTSQYQKETHCGDGEHLIN
uniref:B box-type domain-containing protein n=1 Tax=Anabas testudineus TaxID=64144 RepID=A0A7N6A0T9_ANATE